MDQYKFFLFFSFSYIKALFNHLNPYSIIWICIRYKQAPPFDIFLNEMYSNILKGFKNKFSLSAKQLYWYDLFFCVVTDLT